LYIGDNGTVGINCEFYSDGKLVIGDDFLFGSNIVIHTGDHNCSLGDLPFISQGSWYGEVVIGNNVYIGSNCVILCGVIISDNVVVGAGSVVTKSLESGWIYAGNPAKQIKRLHDAR
jgi:maltose O-acetyltransferase